MKLLAALAALAMSASLWAQEGGLAADFRREAESAEASCGDLKKLADCGQFLFTGQPLHIAVGSLAPQNGFGAGLASAAHYTPNEHWRIFWNLDAVATPNRSWRAGAYMSIVPIRHKAITMHPGGAGVKGHGSLQEMPVIHVYAQSTSLNSVSYFGLGPNSTSTPTYFGMTETISGTNLVWPLATALKISLLGEANGRFFQLRGGLPASGPSIDQIYDNVSAPGLLSQPGFAQFGEGVRMGPSLANDHVRLDYTLKFQEWVAGSSAYTFRRLTANLSHEFPLYQGMRSSLPSEFNGPDSCSMGVTTPRCPGISRNLEGSFGLMFLYTGSFTSNGSVVPFFLDPTIGGSDINGTPLLPSLRDYRFRAPNLMVLRGSFEHSIYKWPVGAKFMVDEGRVATNPGDLGFSHLLHSYAAGLTVHAGGLPVIDLLFCWGGHEGTHTIASVSTSLLGGTSRPLLY